MHKYFVFHVLLPAHLALAPGVTSGTLWVLILHTAAVTAEPAQPCVGHQFSWEISFLTRGEYMKWHIISQILQKRQQEEEMTTNSCSQRQPPRLLPALGRGSLPPACDCMEHILSHPSILAGVLHSNHLQRINTMWTIPLSHFIISQRS